MYSYTVQVRRTVYSYEYEYIQYRSGMGTRTVCTVQGHQYKYRTRTSTVQVPYKYSTGTSTARVGDSEYCMSTSRLCKMVVWQYIQVPVRTCIILVQYKYSTELEPHHADRKMHEVASLNDAITVTYKYH